MEDNYFLDQMKGYKKTQAITFECEGWWKEWPTKTTRN